MSKQFMLTVIAALLGAVIAFSAGGGNPDGGPHYGENGNPLEDGGPHAENCFQMHDEAPNGPWGPGGGE